MDETDDLPVMASPRSFYRVALRRGLTPPEAGRLTAWRCGVWRDRHKSPDYQPAAGWTLIEVERLGFFLFRVARDGIGGPDDGA